MNSLLDYMTVNEVRTILLLTGCGSVFVMSPSQTTSSVETMTAFSKYGFVKARFASTSATWPASAMKCSGNFAFFCLHQEARMVGEDVLSLSVPSLSQMPLRENRANWEHSNLHCLQKNHSQATRCKATAAARLSYKKTRAVLRGARDIMLFLLLL